MTTNNDYILIPRTWEYVKPYMGKRDFTGVIKLRILRWTEHPGIWRWAQWNHKGPYQREAGSSESEKEKWFLLL